MTNEEYKIAKEKGKELYRQLELSQRNKLNRWESNSSSFK